MGDIGSDTSAQLHMMRDAYEALKAICPQGHVLLELATLDDDRDGFTFTPEYERRCVRDTDDYKVQGYARYTEALRDATKNGTFRLLDTNPPCRF